jgi:hypothetical protein
MNYYNLKNIDKEIYANIYLISIDELKSVFNAIPIKKIYGPPDEFPYFKKIIQYIYEIIILFEKNDNLIKTYMDNIYFSRNINTIIIIIESLIDNNYQYDNYNIHTFCKLFDIFEKLYIISHFFHFNVPSSKINYFKPNYKSSYITIYHTNKNIYIQSCCVTYIQFFDFLSNSGYYNKNYWSNEGLNWLKNYPKKHPYFWKKVNNEWYIKKFDKYIKLNDILNQPIDNLSYYEAEAYCKYKQVELPKLEYLKELFNDNYYSNNICEWTITKCNKTSNFCFGRSYYNKLTIKNINDTEVVNKSAQHYFTGFRYISIS